MIQTKEKVLTSKEISKIEQNNKYEELSEFTRESGITEDKKINTIKSTVRYLKDNKKISDDFIAMFSTLSFEEIICLRLELTSNLVKNRLFGFALKRTLIKLFTNVIDSYALTHFRTNRDAANFLGITNEELTLVKLKRKKRVRPTKEYWS